MNAFIAAVIEKKTILIANEGRLLKKSFLGFVILIMAFQANTFGELVRQALVDAYLQVSVFVGFTLFIFIGLDSLTNFNIAKVLDKTKKFHIIMASLLGALPGCGGAIIVVTQYIQGRISFGSLVAVLTATMGDAAFLLLAAEPITGLFIFAKYSCISKSTISAEAVLKISHLILDKYLAAFIPYGVDIKSIFFFLQKFLRMT